MYTRTHMCVHAHPTGVCVCDRVCVCVCVCATNRVMAGQKTCRWGVCDLCVCGEVCVFVISVCVF